MSNKTVSLTTQSERCIKLVRIATIFTRSMHLLEDTSRMAQDNDIAVYNLKNISDDLEVLTKLVNELRGAVDGDDE